MRLFVANLLSTAVWFFFLLRGMKMMKMMMMMMILTMMKMMPKLMIDDNDCDYFSSHLAKSLWISLFAPWLQSVFSYALAGKRTNTQLPLALTDTSHTPLSLSFSLSLSCNLSPALFTPLSLLHLVLRSPSVSLPASGQRPL